MPRFTLFTANDLHHYLAPRSGEVKLGERCALLTETEWSGDWENAPADFVLLGLPEDIGVRANLGLGGARTAWPAFLKSFLNIQETVGLNGSRFILLGQLAVEDEETPNAAADLRNLTADIDNIVSPVIERIVAAGKIPVVIGGGHNNAFPIIKGSATALKRPLNALNLDAHTDYRPMEGRHSGNGFRYARENGFLKNYAVLGLHEAYNSQEIMDLFNSDPGLKYVFWEDIFLRKKISWEKTLAECLDHVKAQSFGVELDVDAIENALSSAATPVGISAAVAMSFLYRCGRETNAVYLHLPEAVVQRSDGVSQPLTGKLLSYLVQGFCKGVLER